VTTRECSRPFDGRASGADHAASHQALLHGRFLAHDLLDRDTANNAWNQVDGIADAEEEIPRRQSRGVREPRRTQGNVETRGEGQAVQHLGLHAEGHPVQILVVLAGNVGPLSAGAGHMLLIVDLRIRIAGEVLEVVLENGPQGESLGNFVKRRIGAHRQPEAAFRNAVGEHGDVAREGGGVVRVVVDQVLRVVHIIAQAQVDPQRQLRRRLLEVIAGERVHPHRGGIGREGNAGDGGHEAQAEFASHRETGRHGIGNLGAKNQVPEGLDEFGIGAIALRDANPIAAAQTPVAVGRAQNRAEDFQMLDGRQPKGERALQARIVVNPLLALDQEVAG
jgi:hypothetical protein